MIVNIIPDDFRFMNGLHTTVRRLSVCTQIIRVLGRHQLPKELIKNSIIEWSKNHEIQHKIYKNSKGKITQNGTVTTAFEHYLDLCVELKLAGKFHQIYSNSRLSALLEYFSSDNLLSNDDEELNETEALFYFLILLREDADGLLLIFNIINKHEEGLSQSDLLLSFKEALNARLLAKQGTSNLKLNNALNEKLRAVNYTWHKSEIYAEHLLIPRCEWLSQLGLIKIFKSGSKTIYISNERTKIFLARVPKITNSDIYDIDEDWYYKNASSSYILSSNKMDTRLFRELDENLKVDIIINNIEIAKHIVQTSSTNRVPIFDTLFFIILMAFKTQRVIVDFEELLVLLRQGMHTLNKEYIIKEQARKNEGYISILTKTNEN